MLYSHRHAGIGEHGHLFLWAFGDWLPIFDQLLNDHLHNFVDVLERLFFSVSPRSRTVLLQSGTVSVPTIFVRLYHNLKSVRLHRLHMSHCARNREKIKMRQALAAARFARRPSGSDSVLG